MFGKFFASAFEGSMYGAGPEVFALWGYVISHTVNSRVEINPVAVGPKIGMPPAAVIKALEYLEAEDPHSRSKLENGRRMVKGKYSYLIPNHRTYLMIKKSEDLREYNARKQREYRALKKGLPLPGETAYDKALAEGRDGDAAVMLARQPVRSSVPTWAEQEYEAGEKLRKSGLSDAEWLKTPDGVVWTEKLVRHEQEGKAP